MVKVFKTNILKQKQAKPMLSVLLIKYPDFKINFDLSDCDKILRVKGKIFHQKLITLLNTDGLSIKQESMPRKQEKNRTKGILIQPKTKHYIANETNERLHFLVISQPTTNNDRTTIK